MASKEVDLPGLVSTPITSFWPASFHYTGNSSSLPKSRSWDGLLIPDDGVDYGCYD